MKRRSFFKQGALATLGGMLTSSFDLRANTILEENKGKKAKNIIFMVSDGMSVGTLVMADIYIRRKFDRPSNWMGLYETNLVQRGLMDMASASSIVTDSAAASSSWGGGVRVNNGSLNISPDGKENLPILQKFKKAGKKVGCVTTVPITHATPAGFSVWSERRNDMEGIALKYTELGFDVMMGGGNKVFNPSLREDGKDVYAILQQKGYTVVRNRANMQKASLKKPLFGVFADVALPYTVDHMQDEVLKAEIPTLAEMTAKAIDVMKNHPQGFVIQVEAGKVDWAAHGNDLGGLIYDQVAFDDAVKVAIDFAKKDGNTLVVLTSDHGNANPGLIYGKQCNGNFDRIQDFKHSNDWILQNIKPTDGIAKVKESVYNNCGKMSITDDQARELLTYYAQAGQEDGIYNYNHLPYKLFSEIQKAHTSVGWISMDHSSDFVELAMFGPGSEKLKPFMRNTDMHKFLLDVAEVEDKF